MKKGEVEEMVSQSIWMRVGTFLTYVILVIYGLFYHFSWKFSLSRAGKRDPLKDNKGKGYAPLVQGFGSFFQKFIYGAINDCWARPISSPPGVWVDVMHRKGFRQDLDSETTGEVTRCMNLGSYNYLGFASSAEGKTEENMKEGNQRIILEVAQAISKYGTAVGSSGNDAGRTLLHVEAEKEVAKFVGKEDALIFGMGFATNSANIPSLVGEGTLILSDSLNHASLVVGYKGSAASCQVFKHNDLNSLENLLKNAVVKGQTIKGKRVPWKKILIVVEGIYSMEGDILRLPDIITLKKKYKAYLYVDEAHSIGSLGAKGRGICDYWGVDPSDVDILMGTFTKSFCSVGGYIAANKDIIDSLRYSSLAMVYATAMPPACVQQILSSLRVIYGNGTDEGKERIRRLRENSIYFRSRLKEEGFIVTGDFDSPVIPMMIYNAMKMCKFSRNLLAQNVAVVVVGYPATPILLARARFCMSSAHTIQQLENAVQLITRFGKEIHVDYMNHTNPLQFLRSI